LQPAVNHLFHRFRFETEALAATSNSLNSLNLKEFRVPLSLEVGRIIRGSESASTFNFKKMKYLAKRPR
ncbi:hypothetical protein, partial [Pseudomonas sp. RIT623]|uniref:hypothetical protein n=1 Tax=Pseudomonas sp. RIT623 TaxID=2559075 RepID=UPI001C49A3FE